MWLITWTLWTVYDAGFCKKYIVKQILRYLENPALIFSIDTEKVQGFGIGMAQW